MITDNDIVNLAYIPYRESAGYIWGSYGQLWTEARQRALNKTTDEDHKISRQYGSKWIGKRVWDCSGLWYWMMYSINGIKFSHGSNTIWNEYCSRKGKLVRGDRSDGEYLKPGSAVFMCRDGKRYHIGVYVGDGVVIEAKGTQSGVVMSSVAQWDEWGEIRNVEYTGVIELASTLRQGCMGSAVTALQNNLNQLGYDCGTADGIFGKNTKTAVMAFQSAHGLTADGIVGEKTQAAIDAELGTVKPDQHDNSAEILRQLAIAENAINAIKSIVKG